MVISSPTDLFRLTLDTGLMALQAQQVVAMRTLGMLGAWRTRDGESTRMVTEKLDAMGEAKRGISQAYGQALSPLAIARAALAPYAERTRDNHQHLTRRGPGRPA